VESQKDPDQAVKRLEQALNNDPANAQIEMALGQDLGLCNRLDEAVLHARRAVELAPENEVAAETLCSLESRLNNDMNTVTAARHALSINPADPGTHFNLGVALMHLHQIPEAITHFAVIPDSQPTWAEAQFDLGQCLLDEPGKRDESIAHLKEAVRLNPSNTDWRTILQNALKQ
jgi:tetratricopeptide (TPR) repeat protein